MMNATQLIKAIHWKQVVIYFIAFWLISHGFQVLAYLCDLPLSELLRLSHDPQGELITQDYSTTRSSNLTLYLGLGRTIGLLFGLGYAILLAKNRGGNWLSPVVAFITAFVLGIFNLMGWSILRNIFLSPGSAMTGSWYYLVNGFVLILLGFAIVYFNHLARLRKVSRSERE